MSSLSELKFFTTPAHPCSYLDDREAITLFVDPQAKVDTEMYSTLSTVGFRRSGNHIYRPYCQSCSACVPVRVPTAIFEPARRQKRTLKRNADLEIRPIVPHASDEIFELYETYINVRHADGDMFPPSREQFTSFLVDGREEAIFFEFRLEGKLLAISVADKLIDGLSAIYTFFDPEVSSRGLGTYAVLWLIEEARRQGLPYLYLGYWIKQCQKMSYKVDYQPLEIFINNRWINFQPS